MSHSNTQQTLAAGFTARGGSLDDLETISTLYNDYFESVTGMRKFTLDDLRNIFTAPGFDMESSSRVILSPAGETVACVAVIDLGSPPVHPGVYGCVRPEFEGRGIGTYLITWGERRARQAIARVPEGVRVSLYLTTSPTHEPTTRLFEKLGLQAIRHSLFMLIDLDADAPPPEPRWPEGIAVRTYQEAPDLRAVYRATVEAFRDHWGHVERPEEESLEWWQHETGREDFDPTLWFLAIDGDEIAGVAVCSPRVGEDLDTGHVETLGVRRPWRRRGLALALLHHAFGEFQRRSHKRVGLGVDAESLTGATRLYEKAGMRPVRQLATYEKELRPGEELGTQAVDT